MIKIPTIKPINKPNKAISVERLKMKNPAVEHPTKTRNANKSTANPKREKDNVFL